MYLRLKDFVYHSNTRLECNEEEKDEDPPPRLVLEVRRLGTMERVARPQEAGSACLFDSGFCTQAEAAWVQALWVPRGTIERPSQWCRFRAKTVKARLCECLERLNVPPPPSRAVPWRGWRGRSRQVPPGCRTAMTAPRTPAVSGSASYFVFTFGRSWVVQGCLAYTKHPLLARYTRPMPSA